jgi:hypothetical protein
MEATAKPRMAIAAPHKNNVFISDKKFSARLQSEPLNNESLSLFTADVELFERKGRISRMHSHSYRRLLSILRLHSGKLLRQTRMCLLGLLATSAYSEGVPEDCTQLVVAVAPAWDSARGD